MGRDSIFIPNVKPEDLSDEFIRKVLNRDPKTIAKIEANQDRMRFITGWVLAHGKPKTFTKKVFPWD